MVITWFLILKTGTQNWTPYLFEYICDVIEKTVEWQPNTPLEKYRDLIPDRWKKQQQHKFNQLLLLFLNYAMYKRGAATALRF